MLDILFCSQPEIDNKADGISTEEEIQPTIAEHIQFATGQVADMICKHSYILSNITMMVSIEWNIWRPSDLGKDESGKLSDNIHELLF